MRYVVTCSVCEEPTAIQIEPPVVKSEPQVPWRWNCSQHQRTDSPEIHAKQDAQMMAMPFRIGLFHPSRRTEYWNIFLEELRDSYLKVGLTESDLSTVEACQFEFFVNISLVFEEVD